jgi:hypothetical protein
MILTSGRVDPKRGIEQIGPLQDPGRGGNFLDGQIGGWVGELGLDRDGHPWLDLGLPAGRLQPSSQIAWTAGGRGDPLSSRPREVRLSADHTDPVLDVVPKVAPRCSVEPRIRPRGGEPQQVGIVVNCRCRVSGEVTMHRPYVALDSVRLIHSWIEASCWLTDNGPTCHEGQRPLIGMSATRTAACECAPRRDKRRDVQHCRWFTPRAHSRRRSQV